MSNLRLTSTICLPPNKIPLLALCYVLTLISGCAGADGKNYFPLADGSKWEYEGHVSSSAGGRQVNIRATARVDGETLIQGKRYFKHVLTSDFSGGPGVSKQTGAVRYYRVADDGIYYRLGNDPEGPELLEMPLPIPTGTKWLSGPVEVQAEPAGTVSIGGREFKDCGLARLRY